MYSKLGRKITCEEYDISIADSGFIRIDEYINTNTTIRYKCKICGRIYRCKPKAFKAMKCQCISHKEKYLESIKDKKIILIGTFVNVCTKTEHKCLECGLEFETEPRNITRGVNGCPSCSGKKFSIDKYKSLLPPNIILISDVYTSCAHNHTHKCLICNHVWDTKPNYIIHQGHGCPKCNRSNGERQISNILDELNIKYETEKITIINGISYRFDFYLTEQNIYIEYDGVQHFKSVEFFGGIEAHKKCKANDLIKNEWIKSHNHKLIRIHYKDKDIRSKIIPHII